MSEPCFMCNKKGFLYVLEERRDMTCYWCKGLGRMYTPEEEIYEALTEPMDFFAERTHKMRSLGPRIEVEYVLVVHPEIWARVLQLPSYQQYNHPPLDKPRIFGFDVVIDTGTVYAFIPRREA